MGRKPRAEEGEVRGGDVRLRRFWLTGGHLPSISLWDPEQAAGKKSSVLSLPDTGTLESGVEGEMGTFL